MTSPQPRQHGEVGILGGSFDPPHMGHVLAAAYALSVAPLARLIVIPTWQHPFRKEFVAPYEDRIAMCLRAMGALRDVEVSELERELGGPSYTLRTLRALQSKSPEVHFRLVIGSDLLDEISQWRDAEQLLEQAPPLVVGRDRGDVVMPSISSTEVRRKLRRGDDCSGVLPAEVIDYIRDHDLYA